VHRSIRIALCAFTSLAWIAAASAAPPPDVTYQGRLLDPSGEPLAGPVDLEIRVFDQPAAGTELYRGQHPGVALADGVFGVQLGTGASPVGSFDAALFAQMNRWLEVAVDGEMLAPRQAFSSVAYALQAEHAQTASFAELAGDA
jgi:hypothetical protein